jgi:hypothetical protein
MNILMAVCLLTHFLQEDPLCVPPSRETVNQARVLIGVLQQSRRIPPEFREEARDKLAAMGVEVLPMILLGMKDQSETAIELLTSAGDEIADRAARDSIDLPLSYLQKFAAHEQQEPHARRAAIRWADLQSPGVREIFLNKHLNCDIFRPEAIDAAIASGQKHRRDGKIDDARRIFLAAFDAVQSTDQAISIAGELKDLGVSVPMQDQLGVVSGWHVIGPFPWNLTDPFSKVWPPESQQQVEEAYTVENLRLSWKEVVTQDEQIVQSFGELAPQDKDCIVFARTTIVCDTDQSVQLRAAAVGRLEVRINGQTIIPGEADWPQLKYDQLQKSVKLRAGKNQLLVKLGAMRTMTDPYAPLPPAQFCLRIVDDAGRGIRFAHLR